MNGLMFLMGANSLNRKLLSHTCAHVWRLGWQLVTSTTYCSPPLVWMMLCSVARVLPVTGPLSTNTAWKLLT